MTSRQSVTRPVGFVGLGSMGTAMVRHLAESGFGVKGFDVLPTAGRSLDGLGGFTRCQSLDDLTDGPDLVILMLPSSDVVADVLFDSHLLDKLSPGTTIVDMGSSRPQDTQHNARVAADRSVTYVDAPVSGGVIGAADGSLSIMVGGESDVLDRYGSVFGCLGESVRHVGSNGAGHALKALNNLLSASHLLASCEALVIARRFGLEAEVVLDIINSSSGRSGSTQTKWPRYLLPRTFDSGFQLGLMLKDIGIAVDLAHVSGVSAPHAEKILEMWANAQAALPAGADHTEILKWVEEHARD